MTGEFTKNQSALIEKIAEEQARQIIENGRLIGESDLSKKLSENGCLNKSKVARLPEATGKLRVPDYEMAKKIAQDEIDKWHKKQPPWWKPLQRLGSAGLVGVALLWVLNYASEKMAETPLVSNAVHWLADTDQQIASVLDTMAKTPSSSVNSLHALVKKTLDANPILMFQGQGRLGTILPVEVTNEFCERSFQTAANGGLEYDPDQLRAFLAACSAQSELRANLRSDPSMDVPFFARFHTDIDGARDEVYVLLFIKRSLFSVTNHGADEVVGTTGQQLEPSRYDEDKAGLVITYQSADPKNIPKTDGSLDISSLFEHRGDGFWLADISDAVRNATGGAEKGEDDEDVKVRRLSLKDVIHSVFIGLPMSRNDCSDDQGNKLGKI